MVELESSVITGFAQGAGMVGVFAIYLDRRLASLEATLNRLVVALTPPIKGASS
jgi:hypothetical protein